MTRKLPFTIEEFKSIYSRVPRLCVDLVIQNEHGTILTLRQKFGWLGQWHFPGGTIYYQEGVENAVRRVAKEELGIEVEIVKFLRYMEMTSEVAQRGYGNSISLVFLCRPQSTNFILDDDATQAEFFQKAPDNTITEHKLFLESL